MQQYRQELADNKGKYIDPPPQRYLCIPGNSSSSSIIMTLQANRNFGLIHETEADTVANTTGKEWGNSTDIYRKSFHHEAITMGRVNNMYEVRKPCLSIVLSGTRNQLKNLINNVENGLLSRFLCYTFKAPLKWRNPFKVKSNKLERFIEVQSKKLLQWWMQQYEFKEDIFIHIKDGQDRVLEPYFVDKLTQLTDNLGDEAAANVYRFGLIHFRICMILTIIRTFDNEDDFTEELYISDTDFETVTKIMDCAFVHLEEVFSELTHNKQKSKLAKQHRTFYDALPDKYTTKEYKQIGKDILGYSDEGIYNAHTVLIKKEYVEVLGRERFRKII